MLPSLEEGILFHEVERASLKRKVRPFDASVRDAGGDHFSTRPMPAFRCPSFGQALVTTGVGSEYDGVPFSGRPAVSSYAAIVGTHVDPQNGIQENGVIVSRCATAPDTCDGEGLRLADIRDGISKTLILCETIEPVYSAWMDGQATWVVGLAHQDIGATDEDGFPTAEKTMLGRPGYSRAALGT